jgi:hypothetical protein
VLFVLIPTAWLVALFFGLALCRRAARSDHAHVVALTECLALSRLAESDAFPAERPVGELPFESHRRVFRATG